MAISDLNQSFGVTEGITKTIRNVIDDIKVARFQLGGGDLDQQIEATQLSIERLREEIEITEAATEKGGLFGFIRGLTEPKIRSDLAELSKKPLRMPRHLVTGKKMQKKR
ncbi:MAG: hypothetical protein ACYSQZ_05600 [Planctomycetota bacterium]